MNARPVAAATVGVILLTSLLSGPLLPAVDLTAEDSFSVADIGEGRATVSNVTFSDAVRFDRGAFGAGSYYLRVPSATADVESVAGRPILSYEVSVPELGFTRSAITVLSPASEGRMELTMDEAAFGRDEIEGGSYDGRLTVDVRYGGRERVVASEKVTIEVVG